MGYLCRLASIAALLILLPAPVASQGDSATVQVVRVIDGDTIEVCCIGWKRESIRYIGIDSPETNHPTKGMEAYGKEAAGRLSGYKVQSPRAPVA